MQLSRLLPAAALLLLMLQGTANASKTLTSDSFEIGVEGQYYQYREPLFAKLEGGGFGLDGTYQYNFSNYFVRANVIADFYDLDYSSDGTGSNSGIADYKQDYRGMFGYNIKVSKGTTVSPYSGFGYRLLFDTGGTQLSSTGVSGYDRRSEYLYVPFGVGLGFRTGHWNYRTFAEYDYLVQGYQTTYLRDLGFDNNILSKQNGGYGVRGNFLVSPPIDFYNLSFGPYFRYWNIKDSQIQPLSIGGIPDGYGLEPHNNTTELGLSASIRFQ